MQSHFVFSLWRGKHTASPFVACILHCTLYNLHLPKMPRAMHQAAFQGRAVLNAKKKKSRPERGNFKRARGQYMSSPRCSQLFNHESLAPNWSQHTTI